MSPLKANVYHGDDFVESMETFIELVDSDRRDELRFSVEDGPAQTFAELSEDAVYVSCMANAVVWEWEKQSEADVLELCRVESDEKAPHGKPPSSGTILVCPFKEAPANLQAYSRSAERGCKDDCIVIFPPGSNFDFHSYPHWVDGLGSGNIAPDLVRLHNGAFMAVCYQ